jgi:hypothetical protein
VVNVETWCERSKDISLMKKIGFEMFSEIGVFVNFWCSNWLGTFRALGLARL